MNINLKANTIIKVPKWNLKKIKLYELKLMNYV